MKKTKYLLLIGLITLINGGLMAQCETKKASKDGAIEWQVSDFLNNRQSDVVITSNPQAVGTPYGEGVLFDGVDDGIFLDYTPLLGMSEFTVEVIMRPDTNGLAEQRFLHLGEVSGERIMLETRLTDDGFWYVDGYVKCGEEYLILIDSTKLHPLNEWYNVTMVNDNGQVELFINGKSELKGSLPFNPFTKGKSSIGVRLNRVYWYKGAMHRIRITPEALSPDKLLKI